MRKAERKDNLTETLKPERKPIVRPAEPAPGRATVSFNPETSLVIIIDIKQATIVGSTELLTQSFGHGLVKDIRCEVWASKQDETGAVKWSSSTVAARSGNALRYSLAGIAHKLIQESKALAI